MTSISLAKSTPGVAYHMRPAAGTDVFARPLLFVHGAWHGAWCWNEHFLKYFAEQGFEVLALDLPGHGGLASKRSSMRMLGVSDYVRAVVAAAELCDRPPILVGHSMGGYVVQKYMEKHRRPESRMILLASVPPAGVLRATLGIALRYPTQFLEVLFTLKLLPLVRAAEHSRAHFFSDGVSESDFERFHALIGDEAFRAFLDMLILKLPRKKKIRGVPALVLGAREDRIFSPAEVLATARAYDAELTIFPDMAHDMMLEPGWAAVADCMIAWLRNFRPPAS
ncbi:MAG: alpha/beta fold hydrolase [Leptospirales bacterium]|jgi:pimeloyl-ACP methyl ester carboxylesterase